MTQLQYCNCITLQLWCVWETQKKPQQNVAAASTQWVLQLHQLQQGILDHNRPEKFSYKLPFILLFLYLVDLEKYLKVRDFRIIGRWRRCDGNVEFWRGRRKRKMLRLSQDSLHSIQVRCMNEGLFHVWYAITKQIYICISLQCLHLQIEICLAILYCFTQPFSLKFSRIL